MFMRYRGGGVGHLYMRTIEPWLSGTGWGSGDVLAPDNDSDLEGGDESNNDDEPEGNAQEGNSEDEISDDDRVSDRSGQSDQEDSPDVDPDAEFLSDGEDE